VPPLASAFARLEPLCRLLDCGHLLCAWLRGGRLELRQSLRLQACHAPDDQGKSDQLEFFVYPNQALAGRHDIITQLTKNEMPPRDNTLNLPAGIPDQAERELLLKLARDFETAGDEALAWEGDNKVQL